MTGQDRDGGVTVRTLTDSDLEASWQLGRLAFGSGVTAPPPEALTPRLGSTLYGAFDGRGRLLAQARDRHDEQWWGGRVVPVAGVASVAVAAEARRTGLARR